MKHWLRWVCLGVVLFCLAVAAYVYSFFTSPLNSDGGTVIVEIPEGASYRQVLKRLNQKHALRSPLLLELYGRLSNQAGNIKAGLYAIDRRMKPLDLLEKLNAGVLPPQEKWTIKEGMNRFEIADLVSERGLAERRQFLERVQKEDLEGRMYPETYFLDKSAGLDDLVKRMTGQFDKVWGELLAKRPKDAPVLTEEKKREIVTIASLVEREAKTEKDRRLIARVFLNRLEKGMKLQTDPTCVYNDAHYKDRASPSLCKDKDNPYSTYVISGLPPSPISNPGRSSLEAVMFPVNGDGVESLLYFVAKRDGSGEHQFSSNYEDHQKAVNCYLKDQCK